MDTHIIPRALTKAQCKGDTVRDLETNLCIKKCNPACDPVAGKFKSPLLTLLFSYLKRGFSVRYKYMSLSTTI